MPFEGQRMRGLAARFADCEAQKILQEIVNKLRKRAKEAERTFEAADVKVAET